MTDTKKLSTLELALKGLYHQKRMQLFNDSYESLLQKKNKWAHEIAERRILDGTIEDGLDVKNPFFSLLFDNQGAIRYQ